MRAVFLCHGGNSCSIPLWRTKQRLGRFFPPQFQASSRAYRVRPRGSAASAKPGWSVRPDTPNLSQSSALESVAISVTCRAGQHLRQRGFGSGKAGMSSVKMTCPHCLGSGKIFDCSRWRTSKGHCCPQGTHRAGCPGHTMACAECASLGTLAEAEFRAVA